MRILQAHNYYRQPGGEDQVYAAEYDMLTSRGHQVEQYAVNNDTLEEIPGWKLASQTIWNSETYRQISALIERFRPQVIHCHNTFPVISPSIYYAARANRVPVVQTLHNYRLVCPAATLYRQGHICEECLHHPAPYNGVLHKCYRGDRRASAAVASMLTLHNLARTWSKTVDAYIALSEFAKQKLASGGLPAGKIVVKPNFLAQDPGAGNGQGGFALFVGRLSEEKGLPTLLRALSAMPEIGLTVAGDGPLRAAVQFGSSSLSNVKLLGQCEHPEILKLMQSARCLIMPSEWYEGFPMTLVEAMACGTPVIASDLGSLKELVEEGVTGCRFRPGDAGDLAAKTRGLLSHPQYEGFRRRSRLAFESRYTADRNYKKLIKIYCLVHGESSE